MSAGSTLLCRTAITDFCVNTNERRSGSISLGLFDSCANSGTVSTISHIYGLETEGFHALHNILGEGNISAAFNGNTVAVINNNELAQAQSTCKREGLRGNALHKAAIAA